MDCVSLGYLGYQTTTLWEGEGEDVVVSCVLEPPQLLHTYTYLLLTQLLLFTKAEVEELTISGV